MQELIRVADNYFQPPFANRLKAIYLFFSLPVTGMESCVLQFQFHFLYCRLTSLSLLLVLTTILSQYHWHWQWFQLENNTQLRIDPTVTTNELLKAIYIQLHLNTGTSNHHTVTGTRLETMKKRSSETLRC